MDSAEEMAADIALAMNGGEWKDGKWYSKGHREAWIKAVKPYADEIERLRTGNRLHLELAEIQNAEIERLRGNCFGYPALLDNLPHETLMALHDHIHTIIDERNGGSISQARKVKAKKARSALQQKDTE